MLSKRFIDVWKNRLRQKAGCKARLGGARWASSSLSRSSMVYCCVVVVQESLHLRVNLAREKRREEAKSKQEAYTTCTEDHYPNSNCIEDFNKASNYWHAIAYRGRCTFGLVLCGKFTRKWLIFSEIFLDVVIIIPIGTNRFVHCAMAPWSWNTNLLFHIWNQRLFCSQFKENLFAWKCQLTALSGYRIRA